MKIQSLSKAIYNITRIILKITNNVFACGFKIAVCLFALNGLKLKIEFKTIKQRKQSIITIAKKT